MPPHPQLGRPPDPPGGYAYPAPRPVPGWLLALALVGWPAAQALAWPFIICGCSGFIHAGTDDASAGVLAKLVSGTVLLSLSVASGGLLAKWVVLAKRAATPADELPAFYRHLGWPWALFSAVHLALTVAYFAAGCAVVAHLIFGAMG